MKSGIFVALLVLSSAAAFSQEVYVDKLATESYLGKASVVIDGKGVSDYTLGERQTLLLRFTSGLKTYSHAASYSLQFGKSNAIMDCNWIADKMVFHEGNSAVASGQGMISFQQDEITDRTTTWPPLVITVFFRARTYEEALRGTEFMLDVFSDEIENFRTLKREGRAWLLKELHPNLN